MKSETEAKVRRVYSGYYFIADILGNSETTQELADKLRLTLTNFLPASRKVASDDSRELFRVIGVLDSEYQPKFDELVSKQRTLEAQAK